MKGLILCLLTMFVPYRSLLAQEIYEKNEAISYLKKGLMIEYEVNSKVKIAQNKTINYLRKNLSDEIANVSTFVIGSGSQIFIKKQLNFRGKTPLIGNRYELLISENDFRIRFSGNAELTENSEYWLLGQSSQFGAGLTFNF